MTNREFLTSAAKFALLVECHLSNPEPFDAGDLLSDHEAFCAGPSLIKLPA